MKSSEIKTNIQKLISNVEDENFLNDLFAMLDDYSTHRESLMTEDQKMEIDKRLKAHQSGVSENLSLEEVKNSALQKIKK